MSSVAAVPVCMCYTGSFNSGVKNDRVPHLLSTPKNSMKLFIFCSLKANLESGKCSIAKNCCGLRCTNKNYVVTMKEALVPKDLVNTSLFSLFSFSP